MPLFGKKKKENKSPRPQTALPQKKTTAPKETTYFGKNLKIKGRVSGTGNIIILGALDGEFNLKGRVKIAQPAKIKGTVKADVISVNGNVRGSLVAQERVHLDQTARIEGQINTPSLSITEGAFFDGEVTMSGRSPLASKPADADAAPSLQNTAKSIPK
ncbi:MAG: polymer-forming cytoskeletal protein [Desulfobacterales bacterium]|jgi:cytoskeletal protein CcmA (bactofilin family)